MNFFKKLFNTPFKKCIITDQFYPLSFMIRIVNLFALNEKPSKALFIPDSLYCIKKPGKYFICNKAIFEKINKDKSFKKKNNLGDNFLNIVLKDLKYSNNIVLRNLIFENKVFFAYFDEEGKMQRFTFDKSPLILTEKQKELNDSKIDYSYIININTKTEEQAFNEMSFSNRIEKCREKNNSIFSEFDINTILFSSNKNSFLTNNSQINQQANSYSLIYNNKINSFLFNLEVEKHFEISEDLYTFYSKLISENKIKDNPKKANQQQKVNFLHILLFETYSEIVSDIFIFTIFINIVKEVIEQKPILKDLLNINSENLNFYVLSKISFLFKKIKKYINSRDNNFHSNLEKFVILVIEELDIIFKNEFSEDQKNEISTENAREKYEEFLKLKNSVLNKSGEILHKIYFEAFEIFNSDNNCNILQKILNLKMILQHVEEPYFYVIFENKTKNNFICVLEQFEFFINLINNKYPTETTKLLSNMFLNINTFTRDNSFTEGKNFYQTKETNDEEHKLTNSDYLIINYMRINILEEGKYIL